MPESPAAIVSPSVKPEQFRFCTRHSLHSNRFTEAGLPTIDLCSDRLIKAIQEECMAAPGRHRDEEDSPPDRWYPFEAKLNYCIVRGHEVREGRGLTLAMSSSGGRVQIKRRDT